MDEQKNMNKGITEKRLLLSSREAARALNVCEKTVYNMTKAGQLPVVRIRSCVRYRLDDLKECIIKNSEKSS